MIQEKRHIDRNLAQETGFTSEISSATATTKPPSTTLNDVFISVKTTKYYHAHRLPIILKTWFQLAKNQASYHTTHWANNKHLISYCCWILIRLISSVSHDFWRFPILPPALKRQIFYQTQVEKSKTQRILFSIQTVACCFNVLLLVL